VDVFAASCPCDDTSSVVVVGTMWSRMPLPHAEVIVVPEVTVSDERDDI
jgi:hypothetical protein